MLVNSVPSSPPKLQAGSEVEMVYEPLGSTETDTPVADWIVVAAKAEEMKISKTKHTSSVVRSGTANCICNSCYKTEGCDLILDPTATKRQMRCCARSRPPISALRLTKVLGLLRAPI